MSTSTVPDQTRRRGPAPADMPPPPPGTGVSASAARPSAAAPLTAAAPAIMLGTQLVRGAVWGPIAIGTAALLQMWASAIGGDQAVRPLRQVASLVLGGAAYVDALPLIGIVVNVLVGALLGVLFALAVPRLGGSRTVLVAALAYGVGVFVVDQYVLTAGLPVMQLRDESMLLASRLVFGAVLAAGFMPTSPRG